jgi:serine/threonine protein kinase
VFSGGVTGAHGSDGSAFDGAAPMFGISPTSEAARAGIEPRPYEDLDDGFTNNLSSYSPLPQLVGDYQIVSRINGGSMADLYLARKVSKFGFVRRAVIKQVKRSRPDYRQLQQMLLDEARATSRFDHPNLVALHEVGESEHGLYLALEYVDGTDLRRVNQKLRARKEALPFELACFVVSEVLRGLHHAHKAVGPDGSPLEVVHRDVTPSNVLIATTGHVKLADFGVVRMRERIQQKTETGLVKGKYAYLAPEYIAGEPCGVATDVYAAGIMLFELLTGRECFNGNTAYEVMWKVVNKGVPMYRLAREAVPEDLQRIVQRATSMVPERRYATAQDMANALEAWLMRSGRHATPWVLSVFFNRHELFQKRPDEAPALMAPARPQSSRGAQELSTLADQLRAAHAARATDDQAFAPLAAASTLTPLPALSAPGASLGPVAASALMPVMAAPPTMPPLVGLEPTPLSMAGGGFAIAGEATSPGRAMPHLGGDLSAGIHGAMSDLATAAGVPFEPAEHSAPRRTPGASPAAFARHTPAPPPAQPEAWPENEPTIADRAGPSWSELLFEGGAPPPTSVPRRLPPSTIPGFEGQPPLVHAAVVSDIVLEAPTLAPEPSAPRLAAAWGLPAAQVVDRSTSAPASASPEPASASPGFTLSDMALDLSIELRTSVTATTDEVPMLDPDPPPAPTPTAAPRNPSTGPRQLVRGPESGGHDVQASPKPTETSTHAAGRLEEVPTFEVLARLAETRTTGQVEFRCGLIWKRVSLMDGVPTGITSNMGMELIGEHLVKARIISRDELDRALQLSERSGRPLTSTLLQSGALERDRLEEQLGQNLAARLQEVFEWRWGTYRLVEEPLPPMELLPKLDLAGLLEAARKARVRESAEAEGSVADGAPGDSPQQRLEAALQVAHSLAQNTGKGRIDEPFAPASRR